MKKILLLTTLALMACFAGCQKDDPANTVPHTQDPGSDPADLVEPVVAWSRIDTRTGLPRLLAEIRNPNSTAVDLLLDVDYYRGDTLFFHSPDNYYNCLPANGKGLYFDLGNVPSMADSIAFRFTYVNASRYTPMNYSITREEATDEGVRLALNIAGGTASYATVSVIFYNQGQYVSYWIEDNYDVSTIDNLFESDGHFDQYQCYYNIYR